jgi:hypothetical protein
MKTHTRLGVAALLGLTAVFALGGCASGPESRIKKEQAAYEAMPADVQAKIKAGEVAVGFTPLQVTLARGKPDRVGKRTSATGQDEVWTYERRASGLGVGLGIGGGSGGLGGGVGVSSGGRAPEIELRVIFTGGVVSAVEDYRRD